MIKIITTKGSTDKNPTVNWIFPESDINEFAELKNVDLGDMPLLHTNDSHFDLVVSNNSDLAQLGSLSYRSKVGPIMKKVEDEEIEESEDEEVEENIGDLKSCSKSIIDAKKTREGQRKNIKNVNKS